MRERIGLVLTFIFAAAITGIIGNRADDFIEKLFPFLISLIPKETSLYRVIIIVFLLIALLISLATVFSYYRANKFHIALVKLDDTLFRLLLEFHKTYSPSSSNGNSVSSPNQEITEASKLLVEKLLEDVTDAVYFDLGIELWRPDVNDQEYLSAWCYTSRTAHDRIRKKFYIGDNEDIRNGIAGASFKTKEIISVHITKNGKQWISDRSEYIFSSGGNMKKSFPHRSLIAVPIITKHVNRLSRVEEIRVLGVLCMCSSNEKIFDSSNIQGLLVSVADRVAAVLELTNQIR